MPENKYVFIPEMRGKTESGEFSEPYEQLVAGTVDGAIRNGIDRSAKSNYDVVMVAIWVCKIEPLTKIFERTDEWPD